MPCGEISQPWTNRQLDEACSALMVEKYGVSPTNVESLIGAAYMVNPNQYVQIAFRRLRVGEKHYYCAAMNRTICIGETLSSAIGEALGIDAPINGFITFILEDPYNFNAPNFTLSVWYVHNLDGLETVRSDSIIKIFSGIKYLGDVKNIGSDELAFIGVVMRIVLLHEFVKCVESYKRSENKPTILDMLSKCKTHVVNILKSLNEHVQKISNNCTTVVPMMLAAPSGDIRIKPLSCRDVFNIVEKVGEFVKRVIDRPKWLALGKVSEYLHESSS